MAKKRFFLEPEQASVASPVTVEEPYSQNGNLLFVEDDDLVQEVPTPMLRRVTLTPQPLPPVQQEPLEQPDDVPREELELERLSQIGYDLFKSQMESIIGTVPERPMKHLYQKYFNQPNYIQLASNEYFNGIEYEDNTELGRKRKEDELRISDMVQTLQSEADSELMEREKACWKRYIGTLNVEAWATRPLYRKLAYQQSLEIKRLLPNKIKKLTIVPSKFGDSAVIRLYAESREIGRLPEDVTRILSPLMDLELANFEAHVMMESPNRVSIGDPFYVQIQCFLNNNTFANHGLYNLTESPSKKRRAKPGFSFASETEGETVLRLKQKAMSRLFEKLEIIPLLDQPQVSSSELLEVSDSPTATPKPELLPTSDLNLDQLKDFYNSNQQSSLLDSLPDTTTPPDTNFKLTLRPYQQHGLSWMLAREKEMDLLESLATTESFSTQKRIAIRQDDGAMNPLWSTFRWPKVLSEADVSEEVFYANLYNGEFSLERPIVQNFLKGGILADEMGLGKTILTLALIHSAPYDLSESASKLREYASKSTLIVVPMSLLTQWKNEFDRTNKNLNHRCFVYYGDLMQSDLSQLLCNRTQNIPIVVVTTYGTVQSEWARLNKSRDEHGRLPKIGLYSVDFFRIVLDEGHNIRNRTTKTAKSVHDLELRRRWILTGTPVVNRLDDIFSLVKFLRLDPWDNFSYWKTFVTLPFEQKKFNQTLDVVKSILEPIFLRRTKNMKAKDGTPLIVLPEKEVVVVELEFSDREQFFYDFFKSRAYQSFAEGMKSGDLLKKYTQILTHILRLRQICCHPDLVAASNELDETWEEELQNFEKPFAHEKFENDSVMKSVMYSLYPKVQLEDSECSICTLAPIAPGELTLTECGHQYCLHCILDHIAFQRNNNSDPLCPDCRGPISKYRLFKLSRRATTKKEVRFHTGQEVDNIHESYNFRLFNYNPERTSAKIEALISHLRLLKEQCPGEQIVVFSQFATYLDLIENEIKNLSSEDEDFVVYKFDGRLNMNEREQILRKFGSKTQGKITILLLSLKAGGVGLNLTCASKAFMMDPWWSPSIEDQAIDRVHRIGQDLNVKVVRFIMKNSIEMKMLKIQERKRMMGEAVEVEEEERRKQRIEEIKSLFDE